MKQFIRPGVKANDNSTDKKSQVWEMANSEIKKTKQNKWLCEVL